MSGTRRILSRRKDLLLHHDGSPYMSRWFLFDKNWLPSTPRMHRFWSSDEVTPHDHPSSFIAMAIWGTATEQVFEQDANGKLAHIATNRIRPFVPRWTKASTIHRIVDPKGLLTLVLFMPYQREWGFWPMVDGVNK